VGSGHADDGDHAPYIKFFLFGIGWKKRANMIILQWTFIWFFKEAFVLDTTK
jgi:hypothetical protein